MTLCSLCQSIPFRGLPRHGKTRALSKNRSSRNSSLAKTTTDPERTGRISASARPSSIGGICYQLRALRPHQRIICLSAYRKAEQDPVFVYYNTSKGFSVDSQLWLTSRLDHGDGFLAFVRARLKASIFLVGAVGICWRTLRATQSEAQSDCKVMRHPDSPLASIFRRPPVEVEAEAEKILNRATAWIQNCVEKREHCNVITAPLPSRLPDLDCSSNINVIRLWETEGARGHYATLSHCWGDAGHFTTSCASIAARK